MAPMTIARESGDNEARRSDRSRMVKLAQVAFGGSVLDCALLDVSRGGARVCLLAAAAVPEIATLTLRGGESWTVRRRWQQGAQVGFSVIEAASQPTRSELPATAAPAAWW